MAETNIARPESNSDGSKDGKKGSFPDPSLTLVQFDDVLGILLASRTERDVAKKQIILKRVVYIRIESQHWGVVSIPEVWIRQDKYGNFLALDPQSHKVFPYPSKRRYEFSFLTRDIFDCAINSLKKKNITPVYELVAISLGNRPGFDITSGCLVAPDDYAAERHLVDPKKMVAPPTRSE